MGDDASFRKLQMNKINKLSLFVATAALMIGVMIVGLVSLLVPGDAKAGMNLSVWWPTPNATLKAVQPFKALVDNMSVEDYEMYWQVDGGQQNHMPSNYSDYPHKEASVDLSGWNWNKDGSYLIRFIAKDRNGTAIADKSVTIYSASSALINPAPEPLTVFLEEVSPVIEPVIIPAPLPVFSPAPIERTANVGTTVWWPVDGVHVAGDQPFKALADDVELSKYSMYWQVDGGQLNSMADSYADAPHKEAMVNISGWTWNDRGPYTVNFVSKDPTGAVISQRSLKLYNATPAITPSVTPVIDSAPTASATPLPTAAPRLDIVAGNPLSGISLYVDPNSNAKRQADIWRKNRSADAAQMDKIAGQSAAKWLGDWNADIYADTKAYVDSASAVNQTPVMVAYNIPQRDCGSYSAGGSNGGTAYKSWIDGLARGIGSREAVVILEPDALSLVDCLSQEAKEARFALIRYAVDKLKANGQTTVYIDAGNSNWVNANDMSARLSSAGISKADGFALNVSNFHWNNDLIRFGKEVSSKIGGKHFVIDTSRNGLGPNGGEWCNPSGRALGAKPTTLTNESLVDAFLWLKTPGESDGSCNGAPSAGTWWPEYALGLAQRAAY